MPTFSRKQLFQTTARLFDPKTWVGTTAGSVGATGTVFFIDARVANPAFSGERLFDRAWIWHHSTQFGYRVGSFNAASGAFVSIQSAYGGAIASGDDFTVIPRLSPYDLNLAIDMTVARLRARQEIAINAGDGIVQYQLDNAASGTQVERVLNAYYYATPNVSPAGYDMNKRYFSWWGDGKTASGTYCLTVSPPIASGNQIIVDGIISMTLGSAETATINLAHPEWLYVGALMHAYNALIQQAPGQASAELIQRRAEWVRQWRDVAGKMNPTIDRSMQGIWDENPQNRGHW